MKASSESVEVYGEMFFSFCFVLFLATRGKYAETHNCAMSTLIGRIQMITAAFIFSVTESTNPPLDWLFKHLVSSDHLNCTI